MMLIAVSPPISSAHLPSFRLASLMSSPHHPAIHHVLHLPHCLPNPTLSPHHLVHRSSTRPVQLNQTLLERDQEIASLQHKLALAEGELEKAEAKVTELKNAAEEGDTHKTTGENLARKVQLLEEELDKAEKDLRETTEK